MTERYGHQWKCAPIHPVAWEVIAAHIGQLGLRYNKIASRGCEVTGYRGENAIITRWPSENDESDRPVVWFAGRDAARGGPFVFDGGLDAPVSGGCRTDREPYDMLVTAVLATLHRHLGQDLVVQSDGGFGAWSMGVNFAREVLNDPDLECPPTVAPAPGVEPAAAEDCRTTGEYQ